MKRCALAALALALLVPGCAPATKPSPPSSTSAPASFGSTVRARRAAIRVSLLLNKGPKAGQIEAKMTFSNSATAPASFDAPFGSTVHLQATSVSDGRVVFDSESIDKRDFIALPASVQQDLRNSARSLPGGVEGGPTYRFTLPKGTYDVRLKTYPPEVVTAPIRVEVQ